MKKPSVVSVEHKRIRMFRSNGSFKRIVTLHRWYVVLDFGGETRKLAVTSNVVKWLKSRKV